MSDLNTLQQQIETVLGASLVGSEIKLEELSITISCQQLVESLTKLRDELKFDQMIDLCGMDYSAYADGLWEGQRFAVVYHLLSVANNYRVRVKVFAEDEDLPILASAVDVWSVANWFEREAFDLFGIVFTGHPDLRRILTDYGFVGNPFRKDFPLSGHVEMHYDEQQKRVVYKPVTVEPREVTPRIVREETYAY